MGTSYGYFWYNSWLHECLQVQVLCNDVRVAHLDLKADLNRSLTVNGGYGKRRLTYFT
jgi:hypothetical protein